MESPVKLAAEKGILDIVEAHCNVIELEMGKLVSKSRSVITVYPVIALCDLLRSLSVSRRNSNLLKWESLINLLFISVVLINHNCN